MSSDGAHAAWDQRYPTKTAALQRGDSRPCCLGRELGMGGCGPVHEAELDGAVVAVKRLLLRPKTRDILREEFQRLEKMSLRRHRHVVESIGFYSLPGRGGTEVGLLIWPVAQYDLTRLLAHVEILRTVQEGCTIEPTPSPLSRDERDVLAELSLLTQSQWHEEEWETRAQRTISADLMFHKTSARLMGVFGCLARAVEYLHNDREIRHKDLKPSQVLVSAHGLWLTDFGWSVDISTLSNSATSNGDQTTLRYQAPERESRERCGRAEDVFGLGCIFLELALALSRVAVDELLNPARQKAWSFQGSLSESPAWLGAINVERTTLRSLIDHMLQLDPEVRPKMTHVVNSLGSTVTVPLFGTCCQARIAI